jgi:integrase/recombinase XerD
LIKEQVKHQRNGQAETLREDQLETLLKELSPKMRCVFAICYYTSCRVSEALKLEVGDLIGDRIVFRARTTKTKRTREVKVPLRLRAVLGEMKLPTTGYLFPGKRNGHLTRQAADLALRKACDYCGIKGVSTHSFRRTGITKLHDAGVPLRRIQARTGHVSLGNLALYVDVRQDEVDADGELL